MADLETLGSAHRLLHRKHEPARGRARKQRCVPPRGADARMHPDAAEALARSVLGAQVLAEPRARSGSARSRARPRRTPRGGAEAVSGHAPMVALPGNAVPCPEGNPRRTSTDQLGAGQESGSALAKQPALITALQEQRKGAKIMGPSPEPTRLLTIDTLWHLSMVRCASRPTESAGDQRVHSSRATQGRRTPAGQPVHGAPGSGARGGLPAHREDCLRQPVPGAPCAEPPAAYDSYPPL